MCRDVFVGGSGAGTCGQRAATAACAGARARQRQRQEDKDKDKDNKGKAKPQAHAWDQRFHGLDRNRNNVVSRAEWNGDDRSFRNHDWNRDGMLSGDELIAGATPRRRHVGRFRPPPRSSTESDEVLFARRDVNRDNVVSRSECVGTSTEFNRLDRNNDGVLSPYDMEWVARHPSGGARVPNGGRNVPRSDTRARPACLSTSVNKPHFAPITRRPGTRLARIQPTNAEAVMSDVVRTCGWLRGDCARRQALPPSRC